MFPPIPTFPGLADLRRALLNDPELLQGVTIINVAGRTYQVGVGEGAQELSSTFDDDDDLAAYIQRVETAGRITFLVRRFGLMQAGHADNSGSQAASSAEPSSSHSPDSPTGVASTSTSVPSALKSALRRSTAARERTTKHVHFKETQSEVSEIHRFSVEVAEHAVHRVCYYINFITNALADVLQCQEEVYAIHQRFEAAALQAAIAASSGARPSQFRRAATLQQAADRVHEQVLVVDSVVNIVRTALEMAQGALEGAEATADVERGIARERGESPVCLDAGAMKDPMRVARKAWRTCEAAAKTSGAAFARIRHIARSVHLDRAADTDYFGGAAGSSSDDSDDDLSDLAADFDRALLE